LLTRKVDGEKRYFNPVPEWFNMEGIIYIPVGKNLFRLGLAVFLFIDTFVINILERLRNIINGIGDINVYSTYEDVTKKSKDNLVEREHSNYSLQVIEKYIKTTKLEAKKGKWSKVGSAKNRVRAIIANRKSKQHYSLKTIFEKMRFNLNSIFYSIFVFASALVAILLILIFK
jgi:hypothetical protein